MSLLGTFREAIDTITGMSSRTACNFPNNGRISVNDDGTENEGEVYELVAHGSVHLEVLEDDHVRFRVYRPDGGDYTEIEMRAGEGEGDKPRIMTSVYHDGCDLLS